MTKQENIKEEIEYEKIKLHLKYSTGLVIVFIGVIILLIGSTKEAFVLKVYLISTIMAISLSIISIIITIVVFIKVRNNKNLNILQKEE